MLTTLGKKYHVRPGSEGEKYLETEARSPDILCKGGSQLCLKKARYTYGSVYQGQQGKKPASKKQKKEKKRTKVTGGERKDLKILLGCKHI